MSLRRQMSYRLATREPSIILPSDPAQLARGYVLCGRSSNYVVQDILGEGNFGTVTECLKTDSNETVAVKMIKNDAVNKKEVAILTRLSSLDPNKCNIARWGGCFLYLNFLCLEFELLDISLKDLMENRSYQPLPMKEIRNILHQLATAYHHLKGIGVIHGDMKPDNVMVVNQLQEPLRVKLIDFGLARHVTEVDVKGFGGTLCYCAPEMLLGLPFNESIDIWALGCVAVELALGKILYPVGSFYDMIRYMVAIWGQPPDRLLNSGIRSTLFFARNASSSKQAWRLKIPEEYKKDTGVMSVARRLSPKSFDELKGLIQRNYQNEGPSVTTAMEMENFADLVKHMFEMDASGRVTPSQVLQHPFITMDCSQDNFAGNSHVTSSTSSGEKALARSTCDSNNITDKSKGGTSSVDEEEEEAEGAMSKCCEMLPFDEEESTGISDIQPEVVIKSTKGRVRRFFERVMKVLCCCCSSTDED